MSSCESYENTCRRICSRRKEMFYLTTHTTHFILRLCGVRHMVKDHWDSERGNPLPPHRLLFPISSKGLYASSHRQDDTYHSLCYTSRAALAGTRNSSVGPPWRIDPTTHRTMSEHSYHGATSYSLVIERQLWDFLPDGKYGMPPSDEDKTVNEPLSAYQPGWRGLLCWLGLYSMFKNRRASLHHHSTLNM